MVCEAHLSGTRRVAAADEASVGDRMMRRAKRPTPHECVSGRKHSGNGMDGGYLQRLVLAERGKDPRKPPRKHRFASSGRAAQQGVVSAGRSNLERALRTLLAGYIAEVVDVLRNRQPGGHRWFTEGTLAQLAHERLQRRRR